MSQTQPTCPFLKIQINYHPPTDPSPTDMHSVIRLNYPPFAERRPSERRPSERRPSERRPSEPPPADLHSVTCECDVYMLTQGISKDKDAKKLPSEGESRIKLGEPQFVSL